MWNKTPHIFGGYFFLYNIILFQVYIKISYSHDLGRFYRITKTNA